MQKIDYFQAIWLTYLLVMAGLILFLVYETGFLFLVMLAGLSSLFAVAYAIMRAWNYIADKKNDSQRT